MIVPEKGGQTSHAETGPVPSQAPRLIPAGLKLPFFLVTALFFLWGVPNNLNDILIKQFTTSFDISRLQAGFVQSAFYLGYFVLAAPAALLMRRFGYKSGFIVGLLLFGVGSFLFWPAALAGEYGFFLAALFVIASGLSFLETASNPFVAQMGHPATAAQRLNFSQAFNPLGSITGVLVGTVFIFSGVELSHAQVAAMQAAHTYAAFMRHETMRVVAPYMVLGAVTIGWAILIAITKFPKVAGEEETLGKDRGSYRELLKYPSFLLAVVAQFLYVGAQVGTWSYFIYYVERSTNQHEKMAGYLLTGTLVAFAVGRFASSAIMRYVKPHSLMALYGVVNVVLVAIGVLFPGWIGLWAIFLTSFFMSVMYPTIFALGIDGLGRNTKIGGSLIVMAIVGGAVLTPLMGWIAEASQIALAYLVPLVCYAFVAIYSLLWPRLKQKSPAAA
ncbi:MAG TPA: L-fucose:H+ symporter permease [Bryobacteraceae bacterium]